MNDVVESVETSFKALAAQKPYRSITVKEICEGAFISRRTFYANFVDKRAVVAYLFRRDALDPALRALELLGVDEALELAPIILTRFHQGVFENRDFYTDLVKPMAGNDPTFELVVARAVGMAFKKLVLKCSPNANAAQLDTIAYYHSAGWSISLEKWICDGFTIPPEEMGSLLAHMLMPALAPLVKDGACW